MSTESFYSCRQYRLLIAGSRNATDEMLAKAQQAVERAKAKGWAILVGDAEGIDSAVIAACNQLQMNYVCFGISQRPRAAAYTDIKNGGTGRYIRVASQHHPDYAARDRYMADLADRALFIWNGESNGTATVHRYVQSLGKPTDLLTFAAPHKEKLRTQKQASVPPQPRKPATVEIVIDTTVIGDTTQGTFGLRALDAKGAVLYQKREIIPSIEATSPDYAKLTVLIHALERLKKNLKGDSAEYSLRIVQSSKNVEGWLLRGWKRNAATAQQLGGTADALLKCFPAAEWVKMPRTQIASILSKIG